MAIEITTIADPNEWNDLVETSTQATPFHRAGSLEVIADHSGATLHRYAGFKGQEAVGIFPVFEITKGPVSTVFSPPPDLKINYLGPALLNYEKQKRRRQEKTNRRFIQGCLDDIEASIDPKFTHFRTSFRYTDARPFIWNDFEPKTRYTYVVDLTPEEEEIIMSFSSDARSNIRNTDEASYEMSRGGEAEIRQTIDRLQDRHAEQGVTFKVTPELVIDLYRRLPDDIFTLYTCTVDGEFAGGHITLEEDNIIYGWQSWGDMNLDVPVNDLLEWEIMTSARERGIEWYDLVGANNKRISTYKAKYSPELRTFQSIEKGTPTMKLVSEIYKRVR